MADADVNWMLSAAVQSGAALVAIVGGLVGARYVGLHSERLGAQRRVEDAEARLEPAQASLARAQTAVTRFEVSEVLDDPDVYDAVLRLGLGASMSDVLAEARANVGDTSEAALEEYFAHIQEQFGEAARVLNELVPEEEAPPSWESFRRRNRLAPHHDYLWEWMYDKVSDEREVAARAARLKEEKAARKRSPYASLMPVYDPIQMPPFTSPALSGARMMANTTRATAEYHRLLGLRDDSQRLVEQLTAERDAASGHFHATAQPEGFGLALGVLTYIALVTMALPMAIMVGAPLTLPMWLRLLVALLFLSGVALLLRYLWAYATFLKDGSGTRLLPSSPFGLLRRNPRAGVGYDPLPPTGPTATS